MDGWIVRHGFWPLPAPDLDPGALGRRRLWRLGYRRAAWAASIGLGLVTIPARVFAGLLGPVVVVVWTVIFNLPVSIAWRWLARHGDRGRR